MDKDSTAYPASSLLSDSCDVYGPPATYWVGSAGSSGFVVTIEVVVVMDNLYNSDLGAIQFFRPFPLFWQSLKHVPIHAHSIFSKGWEFASGVLIEKIPKEHLKNV